MGVREGGREGGIHECRRTLSGCLSSSAAPEATPPGYSPRGNSTRGNTLWVCRSTGQLGAEKGGGGGGGE